MEVSRLRSAPLDTTRGWAGEADPPENTSSRPETRIPTTVGATWRDPHGGGIPDRVRLIQGGVSTALRFARHDQRRAGEADPPENTSSRPETRPRRGGVERRDPHGGGIPDRVRLIHGGVSASLRSARHDLWRAGEESSAEPRSPQQTPAKTRPSGLEEHGVSEGAKAGAPEIIGGIRHRRLPLAHGLEHPQGPFDDFSGDRRLLSRVLHSLDFFAPFVSRQKGHPSCEQEPSP